MTSRRVVDLGAGAVSWLLVTLALGGCHRLSFRALDQADRFDVEMKPVADIVAPPGFRVVLVATGLNYPSSMAWDERGRLYVLESHSVPIPGLKPRVLRVAGEEIEPVEWSGPQVPSGDVAVGLAHHDGWFYVSHEESDGSWGISRFRPAGGAVEAFVRGLPPLGDHWINYLAFDRRGALYFGVGSATNSGVVSSGDPVNAKWLEKRPAVRDLPCRDLVLTGQTFEDDDELSGDAGDRATTGAYQAYGQSAATRVTAERWCTGSIYRLRKGATTPELVAWGFRNPVALAFAPDGGLLVGMHGADVRGTRPVASDPDAIYRVREGAWYGWPDFSAALLPLTDGRYQPPAEYLAPGHDRLGFVIDHSASGLEAPDRRLLVATTEPHAALGGMVVVPRRGPFHQWRGKLLLPQMGDFRPVTDPVEPDERAGFDVVAIDLSTGRLESFVRNRGDGDPQPASALDLEDGLERPVDVKVGPDGLVYVLDFGVFEDAARVLPKTGKVFRVEPAPGTRR
jgi:glucose/arabinose dehydrogenase